MAEIQAFRAYRYELGHVDNLSSVVAPPYDVIDEPLYQSLIKYSPYNVVRVDLNAEEPADNETANRYTRSASILHDWKHAGVLSQDSARSIYVCHQEFDVDGEKHVRKGFLARVRLEPFGTGRIFPHEHTFAGPKEDRLRLMRATGMNLSPVFGLFPDSAGEVQGRLNEAVRRRLPLEATDHLGVVTRLWPVTDQQVISRATGLMGPKPVFIADGHHRYETCLKYLEEKQAQGDVAGPEAPAHFTMMMLVGMNDSGLLILPTHRLVREIPALDSGRLKQLLGENFQWEVVGTGATAAAAAWELIRADGSQSVLGFGTAADGVWQLARFRNPPVMDQLAPDQSPAWRGLAVSVLHVLVLDHLFGQEFGHRPQCDYVHLATDAGTALATGKYSLAALVPPATMKHVEQIAGQHEKMPQKSTYFYPKLLTGLVFNSLKTN